MAKKNKLQKVVLWNNFHNTKAIVLAPAGTTPEEAWFEIQALAQNPFDSAARQRKRRVERALCPSYTNCTCGGFRPI